MNVRRFAPAAAMAACIAATAGPLAVSAEAGPATLHQSAAATPVYHGSDSGRTVHVTKGETFKVSLVAATDGGYNWVVSHRPDAAIVKYIGRTNHSLTPSPQTTPPTVGAGTREIFTFRATGPGTTSFRLVEKRSFGNARPIKHFSLTVKVSQR